MQKETDFDEFDLLDVFYAEMLEKGEPHHLVRMSVDSEMAGRIAEERGIWVEEEQLQELAGRCLANKWLSHTTMGGGKYSDLQLTTQGYGVAKSKREQKKIAEEKGRLKKISEYIEEHRGLFIFLGTLVAIVGLLIKIYGGGQNG